MLDSLIVCYFIIPEILPTISVLVLKIQSTIQSSNNFYANLIKANLFDWITLWICLSILSILSTLFSFSCVNLSGMSHQIINYSLKQFNDLKFVQQIFTERRIKFLEIWFSFLFLINILMCIYYINEPKIEAKSIFIFLSFFGFIFYTVAGVCAGGIIESEYSDDKVISGNFSTSNIPWIVVFSFVGGITNILLSQFTSNLTGVIAGDKMNQKIGIWGSLFVLLLTSLTGLTVGTLINLYYHS